MLNSKIKLTIQGVSYRICGKIGEGASGYIYLCEDKDRVRYAMKATRQKLDRFIRESVQNQVKTLNQFKGSNVIIQCYGCQQIDGNLYIVLELGQCSLTHWLDANRQCNQEQILNMVCNVCEGLKLIHQKNIVHRDIKPENIIKKDNFYKISDFGSSETQDKLLEAGTVLYWPPEILMKEQERITDKVDIWALGVTIFQVYFRLNPFCFDIQRLQKIPTWRQKKSRLLFNISELTPNFNIQKLLQRLDAKGYNLHRQYIKRKVLQTNPKIIQNLCRIFQPNPDKRPTAAQLFDLFTINKKQIKTKNFPKVKIFPQYEKSLPEDIQLICNTINMVHQANYARKSKYYKNAILGLQLCLLLIQHQNYQGTLFVQFQYKLELGQYKERGSSYEDVQKDVRKNLSHYYFSLIYLQQNYTYHNIPLLRLNVLICSVLRKIYKDSEQFCAKITSLTEIQIDQTLRILDYIDMLASGSLKQIEKMIIKKYYI